MYCCLPGPAGQYDIVLLELGVLHYFVDLLPLMAKVEQLLAPGGRLLLREFHPVSTKLISSKGKKHKVAGHYFSQVRELPCLPLIAGAAAASGRGAALTIR